MTYYRYNDGPFYDEEYNITVLELKEYEVIKETNCGVWIRYPERNKYFNKKGELNFTYGEKFILERSLWYKTETNKRFAWPTKELALISYIARKEKQIWLLENRLKNAKEFLAKAKEMQNDNSLSN